MFTTKLYGALEQNFKTVANASKQKTSWSLIRTVSDWAVPRFIVLPWSRSQIYKVCQKPKQDQFSVW